MLELQLIELEFSVAVNLDVLSRVPAHAPKPSITLLPLPIDMAVRVKSDQGRRSLAA